MERSLLTYTSAAAGLYAWMLTGSMAFAGSVNPLLVELDAVGVKRASTIQYRNDGAKSLAIELKIFRLSLDENGKQTLEPAQDSFSVFPPLASIAAGKTQSMRIQWAGNPTLQKSESYIFSLKELPVKFPDQLSGMQVVTDFNVIVNVAPANAVGSINVVSAGIGRDESGVLRPQLIVENKGNRHVSLSDAAIAFASGTWSETLTPPRLRQLIGVGLVQPGKRRRFLFKIDGAPQGGAMTARVDYQALVTSSTSK